MTVDASLPAMENRDEQLSKKFIICPLILYCYLAHLVFFIENVNESERDK